MTFAVAGEMRDEVLFVGEYDSLDSALEAARWEMRVGPYSRVWVEAWGADQEKWSEDPIWDWEEGPHGGRGTVVSRVRVHSHGRSR